MKKSNLISGVAFLLAGICLLTAAMTAGSGLQSLLFGFTGACIGPGLVMVLKFFYWSRPQNRERYKVRLEDERIESQDELKEKIRDQAGRYAYLAGLAITCISLIVFSVMGSLEKTGSYRMILLYLGAYLAFQIVIGHVFFLCIMGKY